MEAISVQRSQVVLFCLPLSRARGAVPPTAKSLSVLFSSLAFVQKVLIFKRKGMMKAFVQLSSSEGASLAIQLLNGLYLNEHGKMQIYFAQLTQIAPSSTAFDVWERSVSQSSNSSESSLQSDSTALRPFKKPSKEAPSLRDSLPLGSQVPQSSQSNPRDKEQSRGEPAPEVLPTFCSGYPLPPTAIFDQAPSRAFSASKEKAPSLSALPTRTSFFSGVESYPLTSPEGGAS